MGETVRSNMLLNCEMRETTLKILVCGTIFKIGQAAWGSMV